jgi:serine/threonine protein kinase
MPSPDPSSLLSEQEIFDVAVELPPSERAAYLEEACEGRPDVRAGVEYLLASLNDDAFMQRAADSTATPEVEAELARLKPEEAGERIGNFKLCEKIGEGGFGTVWVAEQEKPVRRRVALKIIKLGMDTKEVIARFEQERQALAMMDHPNIAKVLDAGATSFGRPYFVMELVRGIKITKYCDQANLPTAERLQLFIAVCQAVQHAHQKGIIHRDLKPSNILVTLHDGVPVPKVIDFGVAKATQQQRLTDLTIYTQFEQMIGTPLYMSPEQAEMSGLDVDTRSDIYSLGVLLYELLVGRTPFDPETLMKAGLDEMRRVIREQEPQRPSTFVSTMAVDLRTTIARHRSAEGAKLIHMIRGDLDWIVMKALEKDRTRRYETASAFAQDIQRHLLSEPVQARPPTQLYRFRRFARRNKLAFAATSAVLAALLIGLGTSTWMFCNEKHARERAIEAEQAQNKERQKAESEARKSKEVAQFLKDMLGSVNPGLALGRDTTLLREILDNTEKRVSIDLKDQPDIEAELRSSIGRVYMSLGESVSAESMFRKALELRERQFGHEHLSVAESLCDLAFVICDTNDTRKYDEAEMKMREAITLQSKLLGEKSSLIGITMNRLAFLYSKQGKYADAEIIAHKALALNRELIGTDSCYAAYSLLQIAAVREKQGKPAESEVFLREAIAIVRKLWGDDNFPMVGVWLTDLAASLRHQGKLAESETMNREGLALLRKGYGDHPYTAKTLHYLGRILEKQEKFAEAEAAYREAVAIRLRVNGIADVMGDEPVYRLVTFLFEHGKKAEGETLWREYTAMAKEKLGSDHPTIAYSLGRVAGLFIEAHEYEKAELLVREGLSIRERILPNDWWTFLDRSRLGGILLRQNKFAEAEPLLLTGYEGMQKRQDNIPEGDRERLRDGLSRLVQFYEATANPVESDNWRRKLFSIILVKGRKDGTLKLSFKPEELRDLEILRGEEVNELNIERTLVADFTPLEGLPLKKLNVREAALHDLSFLRASRCGTTIEELWLRRTKVTDLSPLTGCTALKLLDIGETTIADLSALAGMPLTSLFLDGSQVTDVAPLLQCPTLENIIVPTGAQNVVQLKALPKLRFISYQRSPGDQIKPRFTAEEFWASREAEEEKRRSEDTRGSVPKL